MKFVFKDPAGKIMFKASLASVRCCCHARTGGQCKKRTVIGIRYCWQHLLKVKRLRIKASPISGKGLFAIDKTQGPDAIIFRPGDRIIAYDGERVSKETIDARYGEWTAPYGIRARAGVFENGATQRGVGTLINHADKKYANSRFSVGNDHRVYFVATRIIRNNREILCPYGPSYRFNEKTKYSTYR